MKFFSKTFPKKIFINRRQCFIGSREMDAPECIWLRGVARKNVRGGLWILGRECFHWVWRYFIRVSLLEQERIQLQENAPKYANDLAAKFKTILKGVAGRRCPTLHSSGYGDVDALMETHLTDRHSKTMITICNNDYKVGADTFYSVIINARQRPLPISYSRQETSSTENALSALIRRRNPSRVIQIDS